MKLLRNLSGNKLADPLCRHWQYVHARQVGSHIILQTDTPSHGHQVVPAHTPLRIGTLNTILCQVAAHKGVSREDILRDL